MTTTPVARRSVQYVHSDFNVKNAGKSAAKAWNFCVKNLLLNKLFRINYSWLGCRISTEQDTLTDREKEAAQKKSFNENVMK